METKGNKSKDEGKKKDETKSKAEGKKKDETKSPSGDTKKTVKKTPKFSVAAFCNLIGATPSLRHVVNRKFSSEGRKTEQEWKEIFEKQGLI